MVFQKLFYRINWKDWEKKDGRLFVFRRARLWLQHGEIGRSFTHCPHFMVMSMVLCRKGHGWGKIHSQGI